MTLIYQQPKKQKKYLKKNKMDQKPKICTTKMDQKPKISTVQYFDGSVLRNKYLDNIYKRPM